MSASAFLRRALVADAVVSGAAGLLMAAGAEPLHELLRVPVQLIHVAGLVLLPYALVLARLSRHRLLRAPAVGAVIATNVLWALASVLVVVLAGSQHPSALGYAFVVGQALVVAAFAALQFLGLRRAAAAVA
jgi:hypothetical protein